jgi:hypothetical protein
MYYSVILSFITIIKISSSAQVKPTLLDREAH